MVNQSKAEDYFSKIPSIKRISGVHFFEGKASLTKLLHFPFYIKEINMIKSLIDFDSMFSILSINDILEFMRLRIKNKIQLKILRKQILKYKYEEDDIKELREKRFLPDNFEMCDCFYIFGNYVSIFTIVGKPYGVLIENEYYRKTLDSIFENLWEVSEKPIQ